MKKIWNIGREFTSLFFENLSLFCISNGYSAQKKSYQFKILLEEIWTLISLFKFDFENLMGIKSNIANSVYSFGTRFSIPGFGIEESIIPGSRDFSGLGYI